MSKSVLISIQPKWCELIVNGIKTVEVRKSRPKLETPFKCYIYCTNNQVFAQSSMEGEYFTSPKSGLRELECCGSKILSGKVIGEFTCDKITCYPYNSDGYGIKNEKELCADSGLKTNELYHYLQGSKPYAWHISDLKIYDKPKELSEFRSVCRHYDDGRCGHCEYYDYANNESYSYEECAVDGLKPITRPPQSWCYVEECEKNA